MSRPDINLWFLFFPNDLLKQDTKMIGINCDFIVVEKCFLLNVYDYVVLYLKLNTFLLNIKHIWRNNTLLAASNINAEFAITSLYVVILWLSTTSHNRDKGFV